MRLLIALLFVSANAFGAGTHCTPGERVVFSCSVARAKVVSLCLAKPTATAAASLAYRFGKLNHPELVFPAAAAGSLQQFRYAHYLRYQVDRSELSFSNDGTEYTVYDYYDGAQKPSYSRGVSVSAGGEDACTDRAVSRLQELENLVPCDTENALSGCR